jgi:glycosyltransferase involved in cell wall biosynthesis
MSSALELSIVIPVFNEEPNLRLLHAELTTTLARLGQSYEVIYVDDRSTDGSFATLRQLQAADAHLRIVRFRRNFGQTAALCAGFEHSRGEVVVTLDGDLQNDPADIPGLLAELERGYDIVAGWRRRRHDALVLRRIPSKLANRLIAAVTGTPIHDTGCTLKAFRRKLVKNLPIYAEQHRFLPAIAAGSGARVSELEVHHRRRRFGQSKYGIGRASRVLLDLLSILMISRFSHRPLHYFGLFTLPLAAISLVYLFMATVNYKTWELVDNWLQYGLFQFLMFVLLSSYFVLLGLLSELAVTASGMHRRRVLDRLISESS